MNHPEIEHHGAVDTSAAINVDLLRRFAAWAPIKDITDFSPALVLDS